jgi:hypothetical protein
MAVGTLACEHPIYLVSLVRFQRCLESFQLDPVLGITRIGGFQTEEPRKFSGGFVGYLLAFQLVVELVHPEGRDAG